MTVPAGAFTSDVITGGTPSSATGRGAPANFGTGSWTQGGEYGSGAAPASAVVILVVQKPAGPDGA